MQAAQLIQLSSEQQASAPNSQKPVGEQTMMLSLGADEIHFLASVLHEGIQKDSKALEDGEQIDNRPWLSHTNTNALFLMKHPGVSS